MAPGIADGESASIAANPAAVVHIKEEIPDDVPLIPVRSEPNRLLPNGVRSQLQQLASGQSNVVIFEEQQPEDDDDEPEQETNVHLRQPVPIQTNGAPSATAGQRPATAITLHQNGNQRPRSTVCRRRAQRNLILSSSSNPPTAPSARQQSRPVSTPTNSICPKQASIRGRGPLSARTAGVTQGATTTTSPSLPPESQGVREWYQTSFEKTLVRCGAPLVPVPIPCATNAHSQNRPSASIAHSTAPTAFSPAPAAAPAPTPTPAPQRAPARSFTGTATHSNGPTTTKVCRRRAALAAARSSTVASDSGSEEWPVTRRVTRQSTERVAQGDGDEVVQQTVTNDSDEGDEEDVNFTFGISEIQESQPIRGDGENGEFVEDAVEEEYYVNGVDEDSSSSEEEEEEEGQVFDDGKCNMMRRDTNSTRTTGGISGNAISVALNNLPSSNTMPAAGSYRSGESHFSQSTPACRQNSSAVRNIVRMAQTTGTTQQRSTTPSGARHLANGAPVQCISKQANHPPGQAPASRAQMTLAQSHLSHNGNNMQSRPSNAELHNSNNLIRVLKSGQAVRYVDDTLVLLNSGQPVRTPVVAVISQAGATLVRVPSQAGNSDPNFYQPPPSTAVNHSSTHRNHALHSASTVRVVSAGQRQPHPVNGISKLPANSSNSPQATFIAPPPAGQRSICIRTYHSSAAANHQQPYAPRVMPPPPNAPPVRSPVCRARQSRATCSSVARSGEQALRGHLIPSATSITIQSSNGQPAQGRLADRQLQLHANKVSTCQTHQQGSSLLATTSQNRPIVCKKKLKLLKTQHNPSMSSLPPQPPQPPLQNKPKLSSAVSDAIVQAAPVTMAQIERQLPANPAPPPAEIEVIDLTVDDEEPATGDSVITSTSSGINRHNRPNIKVPDVSDDELSDSNEPLKPIDVPQPPALDHANTSANTTANTGHSAQVGEASAEVATLFVPSTSALTSRTSSSLQVKLSPTTTLTEAPDQLPFAERPARQNELELHSQAESYQNVELSELSSERYDQHVSRNEEYLDITRRNEDLLPPATDEENVAVLRGISGSLHPIHDLMETQMARFLRLLNSIDTPNGWTVQQVSEAPVSDARAAEPAPIVVVENNWTRPVVPTPPPPSKATTSAVTRKKNLKKTLNSDTRPEVTKDGRLYWESTETPWISGSGRRLTDDRHDIFCWVCHKELGTTRQNDSIFKCPLCPLVYHKRCHHRVHREGRGPPFSQLPLLERPKDKSLSFTSAKRKRRCPPVALVEEEIESADRRGNRHPPLQSGRFEPAMDSGKFRQEHPIDAENLDTLPDNWRNCYQCKVIEYDYLYGLEGEGGIWNSHRKPSESDNLFSYAVETMINRLKRYNEERGLTENWLYDMRPVYRWHPRGGLIYRWMDLRTIVKKQDSKHYTSVEQFLYDLQTFQHNLYILFADSPYFDNWLDAFEQLKSYGIQELQDMVQCEACYRMFYETDAVDAAAIQATFCVPCNYLHAVVWCYTGGAKKLSSGRKTPERNSNAPKWWPAKVYRLRAMPPTGLYPHEAQFFMSSDRVSVRFFGDGHSIMPFYTTSVRNIRPYSRCPPTDTGSLMASDKGWTYVTDAKYRKALRDTVTYMRNVERYFYFDYQLPEKAPATFDIREDCFWPGKMKPKRLWAQEDATPPQKKKLVADFFPTRKQMNKKLPLPRGHPLGFRKRPYQPWSSVITLEQLKLRPVRAASASSSERALEEQALIPLPPRNARYKDIISNTLIQHFLIDKNEDADLPDIMQTAFAHTLKGQLCFQLLRSYLHERIQELQQLQSVFVQRINTANSLILEWCSHCHQRPVPIGENSAQLICCTGTSYCSLYCRCKHRQQHMATCPKAKAFKMKLDQVQLSNNAPVVELQPAFDEAIMRRLVEQQSAMKWQEELQKFQIQSPAAVPDEEESSEMKFSDASVDEFAGYSNNDECSQMSDDKNDAGHESNPGTSERASSSGQN